MVGWADLHPLVDRPFVVRKQLRLKMCHEKRDVGNGARVQCVHVVKVRDIVQRVGIDLAVNSLNLPLFFPTFVSLAV